MLQPSAFAFHMKRIPQPPVDPALRDLEHHDFWPGFIVVLAGVVLAFAARGI